MKTTYKQYEEYKDSGIDWLGEVPSHWEVRKSKHLWKENIDLSDSEDELLLSVSQYTGVNVSQSESRGSTLIGYKRVKKDNLVINIMLAWLGGLGLSSEIGVVSPAYAVYQLKQEHSAKYLHYLYRTKLYLDEFARKSKGVVPSRWRMYTEDFGQVFTLLPPLTEQQRIADFLDQKTSNIDKAIAQKEELIALLNERKQILINKAVTRGLDENAPLKDSGVKWIGEIPEHWEVRKLEYCAKIVSTKMEAKNNELPYLGMENIESKTGRFIETESEAEGLANYFDKDNVLFGKLRPYLAKVYLAIDKGICSSEFLVYETSKSIVNPTHFKNILLSASFIQLIDSSTYGSKMPRANADYIGNQELPLPPLSEQQQIATFIEEQSTKIDQAITQKEEEINLLKEYKSSLIDSAVRGKICLV